MSTEKELREMLEREKNIELIDLKLTEKAEKWDKVIEYLEITGTFLECDESIVMDVLKKGTERRLKLEAVKTWFTKAKAEGRISMSTGFTLDKILEGEDLQNIGESQT